MNHPKANRLFTGKRLRLCIAVAVVAAFAAFGAGSASADVTPSATAVFGSNVPGAHGDYTITHNYTYSGVPSGVPTTSGDDLQQWIVDSPAGLVGNPNAVPAGDRCDVDDFENAAANPNTTVWATVCPGYTSSPAVVGEAQLELGIDANGATATTLAGVIFILSGTPEVPTRLGTIFPTSAPGGTTATYSISTIAPVASGPEGDFRLRTVSDAPINRPIVAAGPTYGNIKSIVQKLYGHVGNDTGKPAFLTNPVRCELWDSALYARSYGDVGGTANQTFTPQGTDLNGGSVSGTYAVANAVPTSPDCSNLPPLNSTVTASLNSPIREDNPQLVVVVSNPTVPGTDVPKNMVVTLPGSIAADIDAIAVEKLCSVAQRDANACPAASKVGTVYVETPMIVGGLTGHVYLIRKDEGGLPNLAIFVTGAISFRLDATTRYVGSKGTQIETSLANLPQVPFTKFTLVIAGGRSDSLLVFRECPTDGSAPEDGPIVAATTGYTGATVVNNSPVANYGCYGMPEVSNLRRCVKYKLKFTPRNLVNEAGIMKVEVYIKGRFGKRKRYKIYRKSPFKITQPLSKRRFTNGRNYKYKVRVVYQPTIDKPESEVLVSKYKKFTKC